MNTHITNIKGDWQEIQDASGYSVNRDGQIRTSTDIQKRYNTYNELFWKVREKRGNDTGD